MFLVTGICRCSDSLSEVSERLVLVGKVVSKTLCHGFFGSTREVNFYSGRKTMLAVPEGIQCVMNQRFVELCSTFCSESRNKACFCFTGFRITGKDKHLPAVVLDWKRLSHVIITKKDGKEVWMSDGFFSIENLLRRCLLLNKNASAA